MAAAALNEGWGWPMRASKPHYFVDGHSLCGRCHWDGPVELGRPRPDLDCTHCVAALRRDPPTALHIPAWSTPNGFTCGAQTDVQH